MNFFQSCFLDESYSAKTQTVFVIAGVVAVERTTSLMYSDQRCCAFQSSQFSDKNTVLSLQFYRRALRYEDVCFAIRAS
jgi:hypothetical protein